MKFILPNKTIFFPILFFSISLSAQEIYIPYRDGKLWGLSNGEGKEIIAPKFDSLTFNQQDDYDFKLLHTFKDHKRGILLDGKEVLLPEYKNIYPTYKSYIIAEYGDDKNRRMIIDDSGAVITEKPILSMWIGERFGTNLIFHVLNENMKEDLFIWSKKEHKVLQSVFKDYYSISIRETKGSNELDVTYRKNESDPLTEVKMVIKENEIVPYLQKNFNEMIVKDIQKNSYYNNGYQESVKQESREIYYDNSGSGVKSPSYTPPPPPPSSGTSATVEIKPGRSQQEVQSERKMPVYVTVSYSVENDIPSITYNTGFLKNKKQTKRLKLPRGSKDIKIESFREASPQKQVGDSVFVYNNYMTFDHKDKKNILITERKPTEFDTIKILSTGSESEYRGGIIFLLGNKSKKTRKIKYRLMNTQQLFIFPEAFDEVIDNDPFLSNNYSNWTVIRDGKYGVISPSGKYILEPIYDHIANKKINPGYGGFLQLKKDNKYGFLKPFSYSKIENNLVEPIFEYPIQNVIMKYPYWPNSYSYSSDREQSNSTIIVALEDEKGKLLGYATKNGLLYFKN